jgi:hypothetical protein
MPLALAAPLSAVRERQWLLPSIPISAILRAGKNIVGARYFTTMGIAIEQGRSFDEHDDERSRPVAIVNRRLAEMLWPGVDAIGRRFSQTGPDGPWLEIVGITGTGKYSRLAVAVRRLA